MEKTLLDYFNEIVCENYCNFVDFLRFADEDEIKSVVNQLDDISQKELYKYLDSFIFVNKSEVEMAMSEFIEKFEIRTLWMWEMWDISEYADSYIDDNYEMDEDENLTLK